MSNISNLIDRVHAMVGCEYLSSIKEQAWRKEVVQAIQQIDVSDYTLREWSKALSYVFEEDVQFESEMEVKSFVEEKKPI